MSLPLSSLLDAKLFVKHSAAASASSASSCAILLSIHKKILTLPAPGHRRVRSCAKSRPTTYIRAATMIRFLIAGSRNATLKAAYSPRPFLFPGICNYHLAIHIQ